MLPGLYHFSTFLTRLMEEVVREERCHLEFGVGVFQVPLTPATQRLRRTLEAALRDCLRRADSPARL